MRAYRTCARAADGAAGGGTASLVSAPGGGHNSARPLWAAAKPLPTRKREKCAAEGKRSRLLWQQLAALQLGLRT